MNNIYISNSFIENFLISTIKTITDLTEADSGLLFLYNTSYDNFELKIVI